MKTIKYLLLSFLLFTFSCEKYTEDLNTDPNNFSDSPPELIIGKAQLSLMQLAESNGARYAGIFMNQFTGEDRQYITINDYSVTSSEFNDIWDDALVEGIAQAQITKDKAIDGGNKVLTGVAQITEAGLFGELTTLFGDVPYTEANDYDQFPTPAFDSQSSVLNSVQSLLSLAIDNVDDASVSGNYNGSRLSSTSTWAQIANSLKARYYLVAKDYSNALTYARLGINSADGTLLIVHPGTAPENRNLYYQFMEDERFGYLGATDSYLFNITDISNTSVQRILDTPGEQARHAYYFAGTSPNTNTGGVFAQDSNFPLISFEEVKLIEAEAAYRTGDETSARNAFNEVRDYLATRYSASFPQTSSTGETLLKEILEEKYISLIGQLTPFSDIRRTNNILDIPAKVGTEIPQRFLYPQNSIDTNPNTPSPLPALFTPTPVNN